MKIQLNKILPEAEDAVITEWHEKEGSRLEKGQDLLEISTDKATFDVECPRGGILKYIYKKAGDKVLPDEVIAEIEG